MNRKKFIRSIMPVTLAAPVAWPGSNPLASLTWDDPDVSMAIPPYLKPGDIIGITSPAGFISREDIQPAVSQIESWGFKVRIGDTVGRRDFSLGGTDAERMADLQQMLDDGSVKAILSARGGYGVVRIIDGLDFTRFRKNPKWVIGFSDMTVLHSHIHRQCRVATLHSKMCNSFPKSWAEADAVQQESIDRIRLALSGVKMDYTCSSHALNRIGSASGLLVGGNLKTLDSVTGSPSDLQTKNRILFLEDTGEYLYSLDRMFRNLRRCNKLAGLKALVVGGFRIKPDDPGEEFGRTLEQIVLEAVSGYDFPVCFDFPVGHQKNNFPLKCGIRHHMEVTADAVRLMEY